jgi:hypothetical protein
MARGDGQSTEGILGKVRGEIKPLLFLDVDGVVAPLDQTLDLEDLPAGFEAARIGPYPGFIPTHLKSSLPELSQRCEIIWTTTWEEEGPKSIAPLFGLNSKAEYLSLLERRHKDGLDWKQAKHEAVKERVGDRPFIWIDDQIMGYMSQWAKSIPNPSLLIKPKRNIGITDKDIRKINRFLDSLSAAQAPALAAQG